MPIKMTNAEMTAFVAKGHKVTIGRSVGDALAQIAEKIPAPKAGINRNAMQERRKDDGYKSKSEREYAARLQAAKDRGDIESWSYESVKFYLPDWGWYTPDFKVVIDNFGRKNVEFREIKGRGKHAVTDKAKAKFLDCRRLNPEFKFRMIQRIDDGWEEIL